MESRESDRRNAPQSNTDGAEMIAMPYLDYRIRPCNLDFNQNEPVINAAYAKLAQQNITPYHDCLCHHDTFGVVMPAQHLDSKEWIAIRYFEKGINKKQLENEINVLKQLGNLIFHDDLDEYDENGSYFKIGMKLQKGLLLENEMARMRMLDQDFSLLQYLAIAKDMMNKFVKLHESGIVLGSIDEGNIILDLEELSVEYQNSGMAILQSESQNILYDEAEDILAVGKFLIDFFNLHKSEYNPIPAKVIHFIRRMIHKDPGKRVSLQQSKKFFEEEFETERKKSALKVGVISIDDCFDQYGQFNISLIRNTIISKKINIVVFQKSEKTTNKCYYEARHMLTAKDSDIMVGVAPFMVKGNDQAAVLRMVKDHYYDHRGYNAELFVFKDGKMKKGVKKGVYKKVKKVVKKKEQYVAQIQKKLEKPGFFSSNSKHPLARDIAIGAIIGLAIAGMIVAGITIILATHGAALTIPYLLAVAGKGTAALIGTTISGGALATGSISAILTGVTTVVTGYVVTFSAIAGIVGKIARNFFSKKIKTNHPLLIEENHQKNKGEKQVDKKKITIAPAKQAIIFDDNREEAPSLGCFSMLQHYFEKDNKEMLVRENPEKRSDYPTLHPKPAILPQAILPPDNREETSSLGCFSMFQHCFKKDNKEILVRKEKDSVRDYYPNIHTLRDCK